MSRKATLRGREWHVGAARAAGAAALPRQGASALGRKEPGPKEMLSPEVKEQREAWWGRASRVLPDHVGPFRLCQGFSFFVDHFFLFL